MSDDQKTKAQLIDELTALRRQIARLEAEAANHQQTEAALQQSEERLQHVLSSISDCIYLTEVTQDGRQINHFVSPDIEALTGYPHQKIVNDWHFWQNTILHPDDRASALAYANKLLEGHNGEIEYRMVRADGQIIWVRDSGRVEKQGTSKFIYGVVSDITERKQTEQELTLLNQVIAASATVMEMDTVLEIACRELAQAFELPQAAAALLNKDKTEAEVVAEYLADGRPSGVGEHIPVKGNPSFQYLLTYKGPLVVDDAQTDPRLAPVHSMLRKYGLVSLLLLPLVIEGGLVGSLGLGAIEPRHFSAKEVNLAWSVAEQISGVLARVRLNKSHQLLTTAIEQTAESVVITDANGTILYVNPAFEKASGYSRAEAIGQNPRLLKSDRHGPDFYKNMWDTLTAGQVWEGRFINKRKDGALYTEDTTITPVRNKNGEIINYVAVKRDITQELQLEEQYRQAQKMEAIGRLAGGVAHDFNNLLTVILGYADLLQYSSAQNPTQLHESVEEIKKASERAMTLTRQLLTFGRKQIRQPKVLSLNTVVKDVDSMMQRLIGEDIELTLVLADDLAPIKADPGQMEQIIVNLAVNARDAMPQGGKLHIETANVYLDESYTKQHVEMSPGAYVQLTVSDTGVGMDEKTKANIFEPFFTTKEQEQGTGLGLATVYGIVKQSNGHIWVYSEPNQGTTFKVYLPRVQPIPPQSDEPDASRPAARGGSETILLVEDEAMVRELARRILRKNGYTVLEASDGHEAIKLCQQHANDIHLLLTDVVMPGGLSGQQLARHLMTQYPQLQVLYMSGYTENGIARQGIKETAFIQKPFSPNGLAHKIREILDSG